MPFWLHFVWQTIMQAPLKFLKRLRTPRSICCPRFLRVTIHHIQLPWMFERIDLVNHQCPSQVFTISYCWNLSEIDVLLQFKRVISRKDFDLDEVIKWQLCISQMDSWLSPYLQELLDRSHCGSAIFTILRTTKLNGKAHDNAERPKWFILFYKPPLSRRKLSTLIIFYLMLLLISSVPSLRSCISPRLYLLVYRYIISLSTCVHPCLENIQKGKKGEKREEWLSADSDDCNLNFYNYTAQAYILVQTTLYL